MTSISVVLPVRDGEPYLEEVLQSLAAADVVEVLVIDSGSRDRSREIVSAAGVELLEIAPEEFGHGRTRNLGAERTTGDLICFLTQDATPVPGWVDAYREAFALDERVGAAYGPHLPREDTSPMIARELTEFFRGFSPEGVPVVQRKGDSVFLSNVNACYARACWEEIRFPDVPYSEDQAFGRELLERGWSKVYHPGAGVLHAHAYGWAEFMRRYFDEYRGLRETIGHEEPFDLLGAVRGVRVEVANDRRWMEARGMSARERARWTGRAIAHHSGRRVFSALGSRAEVLPPRVRAKISLEGRADGVGPEASPSAVVDARPPARARGASWWHDNYETIVKVLHDGPAPLLEAVPGMSDRPGLHVAVVIPPFARASGGHSSIFQIVSRLEALGHTCSVWLYDPLGHQPQRGAAIRHNINEFFTPVRAPAFRGFDRWYGADVAVATGWQTVYPVLALDGCRARAYLVHDHEPEFYAASAESHWAERSYEFGLYCIAASPWLLDIVTTRYGGRGTTFQFGVDHDAYRIRPLPRRRDTVVFYARMVTPRRAVPLGILALGELHCRRPDVRIVLFGDEHPPYTPFPYEHVGIATPEQLSWVYSEATVGLCLSMTNYSLVPQEMMACGLPCVDLAGFSSESVFGVDGPVELATFDPLAIADAIERLLDDEDRWGARSRAGLDFVAGHDWRAAAGEVDFGLREALREREPAT